MITIAVGRRKVNIFRDSKHDEGDRDPRTGGVDARIRNPTVGGTRSTHSRAYEAIGSHACVSQRSHLISSMFVLRSRFRAIMGIEAENGGGGHSFS